MSSMISNSSVDVSKAAFVAARRAWPERGREDLLTDPVRRAYDSWVAVSEEDRRTALDAAALVGFTRRPGKDTERNQCQDLTLSGSPFPASSSNVNPLTAAQVAAMGAVEPAEVPEDTPPQSRTATAGRDPSAWVAAEATTRGRTRSRRKPPGAPAETTSPERSHSAPPSNEGPHSPRESRSSRNSSPSQPPSDAADRRVADLERKLAQQDERIRQLFAQQLAEPNEDVSSAYVVLDDVWHKIGRDAKDNRCSWLNINALKKREVSEIIRNHSGTFPQFPCELDVIGVMKRLPGVKDAQLTLVDFAHAEVAKFMRSNARTIRLGGTAFSRSLEFQRGLADFLGNDPHATEVPLDWVVEFVDKMVGATRGAFAMGLDTQTTLRLSVSHRLEKAMKVDHLTTNPLKAEKEDFIPPVVMKRIEDAAKRNLDLSWALDQASGKQHFSGRHPANSSRGGKSDYARQRSGGGGAPKGTSKGSKGGTGGRGGRGRGRGAASATPRSDKRAAGADASPDD